MFFTKLKRRIKELEFQLAQSEKKKEKLKKIIKGEAFQKQLKEQIEKINLEKQRHLRWLSMESGSSWRGTLLVNQETFQKYIKDSPGYNSMRGYMEPPRWFDFGIKIDERIPNGHYTVHGFYEEIGELCLHCKKLIEKPRWDGYPKDDPKFCNKKCFDQYLK